MSARERCSRCVISARFPRIEFDNDGVCSFCRNRTFHAVEQDAIEHARQQVASLITARAAGRRYDALVCLSGGKDSTYTLMLAVRKYGLKSLAFTFDNGFLSAFAVENIKCAVDALGVDHVMLRPSFSTMKSIVLASALHPVYAPRTLVRISAVCNSCITMVNTAAVSLALEHDIPLIVAGFTLGQIPANAVLYRPNYRFVQESRESALRALEHHAGASLSDYFTVNERLLDKGSPWHVNLLCLESISEDEIVKAVMQLGWRLPDDVDGCSSNCRLNAFNNMVHQLAYGYNPYELELSHLVRKNVLTREQALRKLHDTSSEQVTAVLSELGLDAARLKTITAALGQGAALHREERIDA